MNLDNNAHSVFLLNYHLVLVIKYRRKVFDDNISSRAKEIFEYISPKYNITLQEWNHDEDHVHILFRAHPKSEISKFINAYKSASSRLIKKEFPSIRKKLWKEYFWSQSFCLLTTGGAPINILKKYIESQGIKMVRKAKSDSLSKKHTNLEYILVKNKRFSLLKHLVVLVLFIIKCLQIKYLIMKKRKECSIILLLNIKKNIFGLKK